MAEQERQRLTAAETELQATLQKTTQDLAAAKTAHEQELQRLVDARHEVEGQLLKEKDLAVKRAEDMDIQHKKKSNAHKPMLILPFPASTEWILPLQVLLYSAYSCILI